MWDNDFSSSGGGISGSVKRILDAALSFLNTKLDLVGIELQEEKRRLLEILILASLAILFAILALIVVSFTVAACFWDSPYRLHILVGMSLLYLAIAGALFLRLQKKATVGPKIFQTTTDELQKDREWLNRHL